MRLINFFTLLLATCFYTSSAQDFPSKPSILKIIGDLNRKLVVAGENELSIDTEVSFKYVDAKFTNLGYKECIVIVPVLFGLNSRDLTIHFRKAISTSTWTKDYLHISENAPYSFENVDTIDINPTDGLKELTYSFGSMIHGYEKKRFQVISLKGGKEKILYSNTSFLLPGEDEYISGLTVGDAVYELNSVEIKDLDDDGIKEVTENKRIGLLLNKVQAIGETYWNMKIEEEKYSITYFYKNGLFIKSKSKLIVSKTDDYYNLIWKEDTEVDINK